MNEQELRDFVQLLQDRLNRQIMSIEAVRSWTTGAASPDSPLEISKAITQAHISELEFVIKGLEKILGV